MGKKMPKQVDEFDGQEHCPEFCELKEGEKEKVNAYVDNAIKTFGACFEIIPSYMGLLRKGIFKRILNAVNILESDLIDKELENYVSAIVKDFFIRIKKELKK